MGGVSTAVILAGGEPFTSILLDPWPNSSVVIAADSGLDHALEHQLSVDVAVGDMDSASRAARQHFSHLPVETHPVYKDASDLDLALKVALRWGIEKVVIIGGHGGRLDHLLINAMLLSSPRWKDLELEWRAGCSLVNVVRSQLSFSGNRGDLVSLIPLSKEVQGICTEGLWWELQQARLELGTSFGLSNRIESCPISIKVEQGILLVVRPGHYLTDKQF